MPARTSARSARRRAPGKSDVRVACAWRTKFRASSKLACCWFVNCRFAMDFRLASARCRLWSISALYWRCSSGVKTIPSCGAGAVPDWAGAGAGCVGAGAGCAGVVAWRFDRRVLRAGGGGAGGGFGMAPSAALAGLSGANTGGGGISCGAGLACAGAG